MPDNNTPEDVRRAIDLAILQHQFKTLNEHVSSLESRIKDMDGKVSTILDKLSEARGGWRTLMWLGGAAAAFSSLVTYIVTHLGTLPLK